MSLRFQQQNAEELAKIEAKIKETKETLGDTEVREAMFCRYELYMKTGDKVTSISFSFIFFFRFSSTMRVYTGERTEDLRRGVGEDCWLWGQN